MIKDFVENIVTSAAKLAFLLIIVTVCAGFILKILPVQEFMTVVSSATAFYFAYKGNNDKPYAGK